MKDYTLSIDTYIHRKGIKECLERITSTWTAVNCMENGQDGIIQKGLKVYSPCSTLQKRLKQML